MLDVQRQKECWMMKGAWVVTCRRHDMAFTLALLGYMMMESSRDTPTPMQMPLILLMHTWKAPAPHNTSSMHAMQMSEWCKHVGR